MTKLISDYAKVEISNKVKESLECTIAPVETQSPTTKTKTQLRGDTAP